jgi:hypothetical protein
MVKASGAASLRANDGNDRAEIQHKSLPTGDPTWLPTFIFRAGYAEQPATMSPRRSG